MIDILTIKPYEDFSMAIELRKAVFVDEQKIPIEHEVDEYDSLSFHIILIDDNIPVACGSTDCIINKLVLYFEKATLGGLVLQVLKK